MSETESYNGWTNRETWAVALHINNDQGWQEGVFGALREPRTWSRGAAQAGEIIRENVEAFLDPTSDLWDGEAVTYAQVVPPLAADIGSLWRVNWDEIGASFLEDISDES